MVIQLKFLLKFQAHNKRFYLANYCYNRIWCEASIFRKLSNKSILQVIFQIDLTRDLVKKVNNDEKKFESSLIKYKILQTQT